MIIRVSLWLLACAFLALLSNQLLLWLSVPGLPEFFVQLGIATILAAFGLLLMGALLLSAQLIFASLSDYFSAPQRRLRRMLFVLNRQENLKQQFYFKKLKLDLIHEAHRKRILKANERKHLNAFSNTIAQDLLAIKNQVPKATYLQLQQENNRYRKQQNGAALLQLQQKIAALIPS